MPPRLILGDGATRDTCELFVLGERPGIEEYKAGRGFVGPAGQELWAFLWRYARIERSQCYVTNLVKTFSTAAPTPDEIARDRSMLLAELYTIRPRVIVAVGAHAARALLPQFSAVKQEFFHGLVYAITYGRLHPRSAVVVPTVHSSAALRQPDLYANAFADDCRAVRRALDADDPRTLVHRTRRPDVFQEGLARYGHAGLTIGLDTEGSIDTPECVTLSTDGRHAACVEVYEKQTPYLKSAIESAAVVAIHQATGDWQVCHTLGIDLGKAGCVDDTMLMAYNLGLPQSLKVLSYRVLGYEMSAYPDLVDPLDDARVLGVLESVRHEITPLLESARAAAREEARTRASRRSRVNRRRRRAGIAPLAKVKAPSLAQIEVRPASASALARDGDRQGHSTASVGWTSRALSSLTKICTTEADQPRRTRWQNSTFAGLIDLPPAPTWRDLPPAVRTPYAMTDAVAHLTVANTLRPMIRREGLSQVYRIDRSVLPFLVRNEIVGLGCDGDALRRLSAQFEQEYADVCTQIETLVGHPVNPNAHEQVSDTLFLELGITPTRPTKDREHFTTQDKYLKARKREHAIVPLVIDARQIDKMRGTYTARLPTLLRDNRYHPNWKYTRTASGRPAEEIILLIPKHSARGKAIRNTFHAADGHTLVSCDLSQIELRVCAHVSRDPVMLKVYEQGQDLHARTAHDLLGAPRKKEDQDDSLHRLPAKTINFQILMGTTEYGLLDKFLEEGLTGWDLDRCRDFIKEWYKLYAGVDRFVKERLAQARRYGYVTDMWNRRRYLAAIHSTSERIVREAERQAQSFAFQAGAITIAKMWIHRIWRHTLAPRIAEGRRYCEPFVWVHDDVTAECDIRIQRTVRAEMLAAVPDVLCIPTKADAKTGVLWGDLH